MEQQQPENADQQVEELAKEVEGMNVAHPLEVTALKPATYY